MTKYYKSEINELKNGSLKFIDRVIQNAKENRQNLDVNSNENDKKPATKRVIQLLSDPQHKLTDQEIKDEIQSLLLAVSE